MMNFSSKRNFLKDDEVIAKRPVVQNVKMKMNFKLVFFNILAGFPFLLQYNTHSLKPFHIIFQVHDN